MKPAELEAMVAKMRALGVTECDGIKLGPVSAPAPKEQTAKERRERAEKLEEHQRDIMFAASHVKPALRRVK